MNKPKLILIDDQLSNLIALEEHLADQNLQIEKYSTADEALIHMLEDPPHCILVDVHLPGMDGVEFTRTVKGDPDLQHIPILLITGKIFSTNQAVTAIQAGAYDYITKPFNVPMLKAKVELLVQYSRYREKFQEFEERLQNLEKEAIKPLHNILNDSDDAVQQIKKVLTYLEGLQAEEERTNEC